MPLPWQSTSTLTGYPYLAQPTPAILPRVASKPQGGARRVARRRTGLSVGAPAGAPDDFPVLQERPSAPRRLSATPRRVQGRAESPCCARRHTPPAPCGQHEKKRIPSSGSGKTAPPRRRKKGCTQSQGASRRAVALEGVQGAPKRPCISEAYSIRYRCGV